MPTKTKGSGKPTGDDDQSKFKKDNEGYAKMWQVEFEASDKETKEWRKQARDVVKRYLDDRKSEKDDDKRTNLFTVNLIHQQALMFGRTPETDVTRKFADPNDDAARVAGMMLQRILNGDLARPGDKTNSACEYALSDFLRVDFGICKVRYEFEEHDVEAVEAVIQQGQEVAPAVPAHKEKLFEDAVVDYYNWDDYKYSPCKTPEDMRWQAFKTPMTRAQGRKRFGSAFNRVNLDAKGYDKDDSESKEGLPNHPWDRANVWEIWSKELKKVFWYVYSGDGGKILDFEDDPLELEDFWPTPKPLAAWWTTTRFIPKPEYYLAKDSYQAIERLTTRIDMLTEALRVVGMYNQNVQELQTLLDDTDENTMIAVENWAEFSAAGGLEGAVSWMPLKEVVETIGVLTERKSAEIEMNRQITGQSDIERGSTDPGETLGAQKIKIRSTSVRMQRKQDIFANFVSQVQAIKAEIISKFFDDDEIKKRSNIDRTEDAEHADEAIKLIREDVHGYRIIVKSEALSLPDFAEMKQERSEFIEGVNKFFTGISALPPMATDVAPELLEMLKWYAAGFRGAESIETSLDRAIDKIRKKLEEAEQQGPSQQPDPKVQAEQIKGQNEQQKLQTEASNRQQEIQAETQAEMQKQEAEFHFNTAEEREKHQMEMELKLLELNHQKEVEQLKLHHATAVEGMKASHAAAADERQHAMQGQQQEHELQGQAALADQQHQHGLAQQAQKTQHGMVQQTQKTRQAMTQATQKHQHGVLQQHQKAGHAAVAADQGHKQGLVAEQAKAKNAMGIAKLRTKKPPKGKV